MAQKIDPKSLTIDAKKLLEKTSVQDRRNLLNNPAAKSFLEALTPTEFAKYFPFAKSLPDIGKALSGGTPGAAPGVPYVAPSGTASPVMGRPQAPQYVKPQPSTNASQNSFLDYIKRMSGQETKFIMPSGGGKGFGRDSFSGELQSNDVRMKMFALTLSEVGQKNPSAQRALMETIFNRTQAHKNSSLNSTMNPAYYAPFKDGSYQRNFNLLKNNPDLVKQLEQRLQEVVAGSNDSNFALHNSSANVAESARRTQDIRAVIGGETFSNKTRTEYSGLHGAGTIKSEQDWLRRTQEGVISAAIQQQAQQPVSPSAPTGLTPESPVPGKQTEEKPKFKYSEPHVEEQAKGLGPEINQRLARLQQLHGDFTITSTTGGVMGPGTGHSKGSLHYSGQAVDIRIKDLSSEQRMRLVENARKAGFNRIGISGDHLHLDMKPGSFSVFDEGGGTNAFGITAGDLQKRLEQITPESPAHQIPSSTEQSQIMKPDDYDSWNPNLKKYIENQPPEIQQEIFGALSKITKQGISINDIYEKAIQQDPNMFSVAPKIITNAITNAPPGELPANFDPNDPIGSLTNVRDPKNPKLAGRQDPQGLYTESEFYADMENRKGSPFNYALTEEGRKELGDRAQNIVTIQTNSGKKLSVNASAANDFKQFIDEIESRGYKIKDLGGFNNRDNVNRPGTPSMHAFGTAIDINPGQNPNKPRVPGTTDMPENMKYVAMKYGLAQIGSDRMHFERVSPALRKVYIQRLVQQGIIKPDDPVVQQRIQEGIITQEEINKIQINPIRQQPIPQQTPAAPTEMPAVSPSATTALTPEAPKPGKTTEQPTATPTAAPQAPQAQSQQKPAAPTPVQPQVSTSAPQSVSPAAPPVQPQQVAPAPTEAAPPRPEDKPKENAYGGTFATSGEPLKIVDTNRSKVVATMSPGENLYVPQQGNAKVTPETRITNIPQYKPEIQQQSQQQPQETAQPVENSASMRNAVNYIPPNITQASNEVFRGVSQSSSPDNFFVNKSFERAMAQYNNFQTSTDRKINNGFDTLFG